jgi:hypothetical protein
VRPDAATQQRRLSADHHTAADSTGCLRSNATADIGIRASADFGLGPTTAREQPFRASAARFGA